MNLFAYGTLMWPEILADVIGRKVEGVPAILRGARRLRVKDEVYPALVPAESGVVEGTVYLELNVAEIAALDQFEGPEYDRRLVEVETAGGLVKAAVYFASELGLSMLQPEEWTPNQLCAAGVQHFRRSYKGWS